MKDCSPSGCTYDHPVPEWKDRLRGQAGRVTRSRQMVLDTLRRLQRPTTPKQIAEALPKASCDLATVYRSLTLFEEMGVVRRVDFGDRQARFEIADADPDGHHHHHLVCRECERIVKLDDCILADLEARLAREHGFVEIMHRLEFFGVCSTCQEARKRRRPR